MSSNPEPLGHHDAAARLRDLVRLLDRDLADLPPASQLVYLRCLARAGFRQGLCSISLDHLVSSTGLSRNTVLAALRNLIAARMLEVVEHRARRPTLYRVVVPGTSATASVSIPLRTSPITPAAGSDRPEEPRQWLVDRLTDEDRRDLEQLIAGLSQKERQDLMAAALSELARRDPLAALDREQVQKAFAETVLRRRFGPARLARYQTPPEQV